MATTISLSSMQAILAQCADAVDAENWPLATKLYAKAEIVYQGLAAETQDAETRQRWRDSIDNVKSAIDAARAATAGRDTDERLITTHLGYNR